ncbi:hypothetical protein N752_29990 [Desulforamulus aquiferis]|nr:hypothetical protein N752_29990 [Desulforamulus aquiferis]
MRKLNSIIVEDDPYFAKMFRLMLAKTEIINILNVFTSGEEFYYRKEII